jgi:hypothetical protein
VLPEKIERIDAQVERCDPLGRRLG